MKRRAILIGLTTTAFAGCLSRNDYESSSQNNQSDNRDSQKDGQEYEQCKDYTIRLKTLPEPARDEAIAALENDKYETEGKLILHDVMNVDESYVMTYNYNNNNDVDYYSPKVEKEGEITRLKLKETKPPVTETLPLRYEGKDDVMVDLLIKYETEEEILLDETFELSPGEEIELVGDDNDWRYGDYHVELTATTDDAELYREGEISFDHGDVSYQIEVFMGLENHEPFGGIEEVHYESIPCSWDSDGNL
jgi:hypothetical protein